MGRASIASFSALAVALLPDGPGHKPWGVDMGIPSTAASLQGHSGQEVVMSEGIHDLTQAPAMQATPMKEAQQGRVAPWVVGGVVAWGSLSVGGAGAGMEARRPRGQIWV